MSERTLGSAQDVNEMRVSCGASTEQSSSFMPSIISDKSKQVEVSVAKETLHQARLSVVAAVAKCFVRAAWVWG